MLDTIFPFGRGNVTKLGVAYFCATLYFYIPVYTLYLQSNDLNYVQINSLWGVIVGTMFLTEVPTGIVADRIGRKRAINVALGLQVLGEVIFLLGGNYWTFALAAAIGGLGFAFGSGATDALMYDSLKIQGRENEMAKAAGFFSAAKRSANLVAFSIGSVFVATLTEERFAMAIAATASAVFVGWLVSFMLQEPPAGDDGDRHEGSLGLLADGLALLRHDRTFRRLVLLAVATVPFIDYLMNLYQPRFVDVGVPSIWLGLALALASGLSIAGARYAYWLETRFGTRTSLLLVTLLPGVLYLALAAIVLPAMVVLAFIMLYGSMSLKDPVFSGHLNRHIESRNRATVLSLISMASGIYIAVLGLVIGQIAEVSLTYAFTFMGIVVIAGSLLFRTR